VNRINEEQFKKTLTALVMDEPEKLAFYDGLDPDADIPPFVPAADEERHTDKADTRKTYAVRRRRYSLGMIAAVACCIVFVSVAVINNGSGFTDQMYAPMSGGGTGSAFDQSTGAANQGTGAADQGTGAVDQGTDAAGQSISNEVTAPPEAPYAGSAADQSGAAPAAGSYADQSAGQDTSAPVETAGTPPEATADQSTTENTMAPPESTPAAESSANQSGSATDQFTTENTTTPPKATADQSTTESATAPPENNTTGSASNQDTLAPLRTTGVPAQAPAYDAGAVSSPPTATNVSLEEAAVIAAIICAAAFIILFVLRRKLSKKG